MGCGARLSRRGGPPEAEASPERACSHCLLAETFGRSAIPPQPHAPRAQADDRPDRAGCSFYRLAVENCAEADRD
jgi:hypothetical protein